MTKLEEPFIVHASRKELHVSENSEMLA